MSGLIAFVAGCGAAAFFFLGLLADAFITDDEPGSGYGTERPAQICWLIGVVCLIIAGCAFLYNGTLQ